MNSRLIGIAIGIIVFIWLCRGCVRDQRRATLKAIGLNMPNCDESSIYVDDKGEFLYFKTRKGKVRMYGAEWEDGMPSLVVEPE